MRISQLRLAAFWLLLLPMTLLVVPRQALHHCAADGRSDIRWHDAAHAHATGDEGDHAEVQANCAICQLNVILDVPPAPPTLGWLEGMVSALPVQGTADPLTAPRQLQANRGPPARA